MSNNVFTRYYFREMTLYFLTQHFFCYNPVEQPDFLTGCQGLELTRVVFGVDFFRPVAVEGESVLGCSAGAALHRGSFCGLAEHTLCRGAGRAHEQTDTFKGRQCTSQIPDRKQSSGASRQTVIGQCASFDINEHRHKLQDK